MPLVSINPTTGRPIRRYREISAQQQGAAVARAHAAFLEWRRVPVAARARRLRAAARVLRRDADAHARLITGEMGKPLAEARAEVEKCAAACEHFARFGPGWLAPERPAGAPPGALVAYRPLGVILAVMPWNFPFWQVFRAAVPALLAGNTVLLKHAANVCGCALAIESVFRAAGFPAGAFQTLLAASDRVPALIAHPVVRAVTLTGSTAARKTCQKGKFQGITASTTPRGRQTTCAPAGAPAGLSGARNPGPYRAKNSQAAAHFSISARACATGLPISSVMSRASASASRRRTRAAARNGRVRAGTGTRRHSRNAAWARATSAACRRAESSR